MTVLIIWVCFEKLKSNWNQTWVKDAIGVSLYVNEVKFHVHQVQGSSEVRLGGKCKICIFVLKSQVDVQLQPNLIYR